MRGRLRRRPSAALVVAMLALLVALSGTSVAAPVRAAAGLITGKQVKNESLTGADIRNGTIAGIDVKKATLLKAHFKAGQIPAGPAGPKGDKGDKGDTGAAAATNVTVRTAGGSAAGPLGTSVATVNCNAGEKVVGGGSAYSRVPPGEPQVWASFPVGSPPTGWSVLLQNANSGATGSVSPVAYVICVSP